MDLTWRVDHIFWCSHQHVQAENHERTMIFIHRRKGESNPKGNLETRWENLSEVIPSWENLSGAWITRPEALEMPE
jgi:hypothetical protein